MGGSAIPTIASDSLLRQGRSLKIFSVVVISLLSLGLGVTAYTALPAGGGLLGPRNDLLFSFAFLMMLTVSYLTGKGRAATRDQGVLLHRFMEEEAAVRALRLDPFLEFHHPAVCREIIMRQAYYTARLNCRMALVEMTMPDLPKMWVDPLTRPVAERFFRELRQECRPLDFWLRWSPNKLLLVLMQMDEGEVAGVAYRLRVQVQRWWDKQDVIRIIPATEWRYLAAPQLNSGGDVLEQVRKLFQPEHFIPTPMANVWQPKRNPSPGDGGKGEAKPDGRLV